MKAARLHSARDVRFEEVPPAHPPGPGPGQALIRVQSVGLCGSDLHYYRDGRIGPSLAGEPLVLGHEFAGEIVALGPDAHGPQGLRLREGLAVAVDPARACGSCEPCLHGHPNLCPSVQFCGTPPTDGALQEFVTWPADLLYPLPPGMTPEQGALLEPLGVLIHAIDLAKIRLADTVAVLGAGPIGLLAIRLARLSGASRLFATDIIPERVAAALTFGAHQAANARQTDPVSWIKDLTGGRGVDVALECAGAAETPGQAVEVVRPGGTVVLVGIPAEDETAFPASSARRKGVTIKLCRRMNHSYPRALALVHSGMVHLDLLVTHRFKLEDTNRAFHLLDRGDEGVLKAMVSL
jgi:L-iditol 2-dehydrogenase